MISTPSGFVVKISIGALIITSTVLGFGGFLIFVYSILGPNNPILIIKALIVGFRVYGSVTVSRLQEHSPTDLLTDLKCRTLGKAKVNL